MQKPTSVIRRIREVRRLIRSGKLKREDYTGIHSLSAVMGTTNTPSGRRSFQDCTSQRGIGEVPLFRLFNKHGGTDAGGKRRLIVCDKQPFENIEVC